MEHDASIVPCPALLEKAGDAVGVASIAGLESRIEPLVERFAKQAKPTTGVFSPSDASTAICYRLFKRRGIQPGKDVEFVSCDNEQSYLAGLTPRPATIDFGGASLAVQHFVANLEHNQLSQGIRLEIEPTLVEGD